MKILITGGHVTPALAVIERLKKIKKEREIEVVFVGRKYALDEEKTLSFEYKELKGRIKFYSLGSGRLTRVVSLRSLFNLLKTPLGFWQGFKIVRKEKPTVILSFGGYIALPIAFSGWWLRIPIYTHEQTRRPGLANRLIGLIAKKVFISFPDTRSYFPEGRSIVTGNPVRSSALKVIKKPFQISKTDPVVLVMGGSLGSHSINLHIEAILEKLLAKYIVVHQTGGVKKYGDFQRLVKLRNRLSKELQNRYFIKEHFFEDEIGYIYSLSDVVVARAGANTFFELIALNKPAVFIPLPWSANKEQQAQADIFRKAGAGEIFDQSADSSHLLSLIDKVVVNKQRYEEGFKKINHLYKKNAPETILKEILAPNK